MTVCRQRSAIGAAVSQDYLRVGFPRLSRHYKPTAAVTLLSTAAGILFALAVAPRFQAKLILDVAKRASKPLSRVPLRLIHPARLPAKTARPPLPLLITNACIAAPVPGLSTLRHIGQASSTGIQRYSSETLGRSSNE